MTTTTSPSLASEIKQSFIQFGNDLDGATYQNQAIDNFKQGNYLTARVFEAGAFAQAGLTASGLPELANAAASVARPVVTALGETAYKWLGTYMDSVGLRLSVVDTSTVINNVDATVNSVVNAKGEGLSLGWPGVGGSGPTPGTIGITDSTSTKALQNYNPSGGGIEFVYDPTTNTFVAGKPSIDLFDGSPHEQLAQTFSSADNPAIVGGTLQRGANGEFFTNENSGHYGANWDEAVRSQFSQWLSDRLGLPVIHETWSSGF